MKNASEMEKCILMFVSEMCWNPFSGFNTTATCMQHNRKQYFFVLLRWRLDIKSNRYMNIFIRLSFTRFNADANAQWKIKVSSVFVCLWWFNRNGWAFHFISFFCLFQMRFFIHLLCGSDSYGTCSILCMRVVFCSFVGVMLKSLHFDLLFSGVSSYLIINNSNLES